MPAERGFQEQSKDDEPLVFNSGFIYSLDFNLGLGCISVRAHGCNLDLEVAKAKSDPRGGTEAVHIKLAKDLESKSC